MINYLIVLFAIHLNFVGAISVLAICLSMGKLGAGKEPEEDIVELKDVDEAVTLDPRWVCDQACEGQFRLRHTAYR